MKVKEIIGTLFPFNITEFDSGVEKIGIFAVPTPSWVMSTRGTHNGYIVLPQDHPWYSLVGHDGEDYDNVPMNVHGGLTFGTKKNNHLILGFDTCHDGDDPEIHNLDYVERECLRMVIQALNANSTDEIAKFIREIRRDIDDISNIASDAERTLGRLLERM